MPFLLLKLLSLGKWLREAATALVGWASRYPLQSALIAALCLSAWFWRADHRHTAQRDAAIAGRAADRKAYDKASADNAAAQVAQNKAWEAKTATLAKDADNAETELRASYSARNVAYADRMRADKVCLHAAPTPGQTDIAKGGDSAGPDAVLVGRADYDILTGNTARLVAVHDWGAALVKDGLAKPGG